MKLACPHCQCDDFRVIETRGTAKMVYRTRRCADCKAAVVTCELVFDGGCIPHTVRRNLEEPA